MTYRIRPGIVRLKICDVDLLVATRAVWEQCPRVRPIPRLWSACWAIMEQEGRTDRDVVRTFMTLLRKPEEEIRATFDPIFQTLCAEGYLVPAEDES